MNKQDKEQFEAVYKTWRDSLEPDDSINSCDLEYFWKAALEYRDKQNRIDELEHEILLVRARNERLEKELHNARGSALNEAVDRFISGVGAQPAQEPVACLVGMKGGAFDTPKTKRAYTYAQQPNNGPASRLGDACLKAMAGTAGDSIDRGLLLLKALQDAGFGVFDLGAEYTTPPAAAINEQLLGFLIRLVKDHEAGVTSVAVLCRAKAAIAEAEKLKGGAQ